jgi:hypothetical protein
MPPILQLYHLLCSLLVILYVVHELDANIATENDPVHPLKVPDRECMAEQRHPGSAVGLVVPKTMRGRGVLAGMGAGGLLLHTMTGGL